MSEISKATKRGGNNDDDDYDDDGDDAHGDSNFADEHINLTWRNITILIFVPIVGVITRMIMIMTVIQMKDVGNLGHNVVWVFTLVDVVDISFGSLG